MGVPTLSPDTASELYDALMPDSTPPVAPVVFWRLTYHDPYPGSDGACVAEVVQIRVIEWTVIKRPDRLTVRVWLEPGRKPESSLRVYLPVVGLVVAPVDRSLRAITLDMPIREEVTD